jgi:hypothetical protein
MLRINFLFFFNSHRIHRLDTLLEVDDLHTIERVKDTLIDYLSGAGVRCGKSYLRLLLGNKCLCDEKKCVDYLLKDADHMNVIFCASTPPQQLALRRILYPSDDTDTFCCICMENKPDHSLMPCAHEQFCLACVKDLQHCPLCRTEVYNAYRVFNAYPK